MGEYLRKNKWRITIKDNYTLDDGQIIVRSHEIMIPPTNGDRTDIITECNKYHFDMTKSQFMERLSKEEYLDKIMPMVRIDDEEEMKKFMKSREKTLKEMSYTPRRRNEEIAIIIEIKGGEITLKGK